MESTNSTRRAKADADAKSETVGTQARADGAEAKEAEAKEAEADAATTPAALNPAAPTLTPTGKPRIAEVLPRSGIVYSELAAPSEVLCKPKVLPVKSAAVVAEELRLRQEAAEAAAKRAAAR